MYWQTTQILVDGLDGLDGLDGSAVSDIPKVRFKIVKIANVSFNALFRGKKERPRA